MDLSLEAGQKGILVGNGYRQLDPKDWKDQFTDSARPGCVTKRFCMVTPSELYRAVNAVLAKPSDESLKARIRGTILNAVGDWVFEGK